MIAGGMPGNESYSWTVLGEPVAKGRPRSTRNGRIYTPAKTRKAQQSLAMVSAPWAPRAPLTCGLRVDLGFVFEPRPSWSKKKKAAAIDGTLRHVIKPDIDNLIKLSMDSLTRLFWVDDTQIEEIHARKCYGPQAMTQIDITLLPKKQDKAMTQTQTPPYISTETGEGLEEWEPGCISLAEYLGDSDIDDLEIGDYVTKRKAQITGERAAAKAAFKLRMAQLDSSERGLDHMFGERLEYFVKKKVTGGKRKSVVFAYGVCGFRRSRRVEIPKDKESIDLLCDWCEDHAPDALKITRSVLKSELPKTEDIPGVERIDRDEFYIRVSK